MIKKCKKKIENCNKKFYLCTRFRMKFKGLKARKKVTILK